MILPTKGIRSDRALVTQGAAILRLLDEAKTVSRLWEEYRRTRDGSKGVTFDWFVLSLDLLYILGVVDFERGRVLRLAVPPRIESSP